MSRFSRRVRLRARKEHRCADCPVPISVGELHSKVVGVNDGGWWSARECARCYWDRHVLWLYEVRRGRLISECVCPFGLLTIALRERGLSPSPITYKDSAPSAGR